MAQALRGAIIDCTINVGWTVWPIGSASYSSVLTQALIDTLNVSGFRVLAVDDSNLALLGGGSMKVRAEITSAGYASERDAASVIAGAASRLGYRVQSFSGALVQAAPSRASSPAAPVVSAATYATNAINRAGNTTGLPSPADLIPQNPINQIVLIGGAAVLLILLLRR